MFPGKVNVTVFLNGWCPAQNMVYERTKKAVVEFGDKIDFNVYHTVDHEILKYWGISDGLLINGKRIRTGPPPSYKKIHRLIESRVKKLREPVDSDAEQISNVYIILHLKTIPIFVVYPKTRYERNSSVCSINHSLLRVHHRYKKMKQIWPRKKKCPK